MVAIANIQLNLYILKMELLTSSFSIMEVFSLISMGSTEILLLALAVRSRTYWYIQPAQQN